MYDLLIPVYDMSGYKFTGKERDSESGLDDFGARYYGSSKHRKFKVSRCMQSSAN